jgi:hypothetical protein
MRVAVVSIVALAVAILIGCVGLFPAFIRSLENGRAAVAAIALDAKNNVTDSALATAKTELVSANTLVTTLASDAAQPSFTDVIRSIVSVSNGVSISGIDLASSDAKTLTVAITGDAPTRDSLLAYRTRLETLFAGTKIEIPIADLAKNSNLDINLHFTIKLP